MQNLNQNKIINKQIKWWGYMDIILPPAILKQGLQFPGHTLGIAGRSFRIGSTALVNAVQCTFYFLSKST